MGKREKILQERICIEDIRGILFLDKGWEWGCFTETGKGKGL